MNNLQNLISKLETLTSSERKEFWYSLSKHFDHNEKFKSFCLREIYPYIEKTQFSLPKQLAVI